MLALNLLCTLEAKQTNKQTIQGFCGVSPINTSLEDR